MKRVQKQEEITPESLYTNLNELSKEMKLFLKEMREETKRRSEETKKRLEEAKKRSEEDKKLSKEDKKLSEEAKKYFKESKREWAEIRRSMRETDRRMEETDLQMKETNAKIREVGRQLGGIGNSNGDIAEEYFQNAFTKNPKLNGEIYDELNFNVRPRPKKGQKEDEYDIVMVNGESVAIIEIKYHLEKNDMKEALSKILNKIETFKAFYPEYENYKFYLGIASLSFSKNIENIIRQAGIAVIKQAGGKMVINSENLKVF